MEIKPQVVQVETHPYFPQTELKKILAETGMGLMAWYPLGHGDKTLTGQPVFAELGAKYHKSPAQIILRWHIQRNTIVIPKSTHYDRMVQNINVFDFILSEEDMAMIAALDKGQSSFFSHYDPNMVEWFVKMVEERKTKHRSENEKKAW